MANNDKIKQITRALLQLTGMQFAYDFRGNMQDVLCVGATPVLVDIRPDNWNLDV